MNNSTLKKPNTQRKIGVYVEELINAAENAKENFLSLKKGRKNTETTIAKTKEKTKSKT